MHDLNQHLIDLADRLDSEGKTVCADIVDGLIKTESLTKVAQYVGVIGYVLKQNRAMGNCIRKKRAQSEQPMQTIVLDCLKEYQDGQVYHDTKWQSKYAQSITNRPEDFEKLHLSILKTMSKEENLDKHIENIEAAAVSLYERGVKDEEILTVLSHVEQLGDLLRRDSEVTPNFKLAAPPSPRNRWSRFWTPSQFSWSNPFSWNGRWQRGEDKDVMLEMENVLKNIRSITHISQQMKTNIHRLKNQVGGYLSGSYESLPDPENKNIIQIVSKKIDQLDPKNWNKNILATQQLRHLLGSQNVQNLYNKEHIDLAINLSDSLYKDTNRVYEYIDHIQKDMNSMRQRSPIRGRDSGLTERGEQNPFGMSSPVNEFGVLEQVLSRLYENPFDEKSHFYAQKMHARLDDRLRYIENDPDTGADEWLKNPQEPLNSNQPIPVENPEQGNIENPTETSTESGPSPVSDKNMQDVVQDLLSIPGTMNGKSKSEYIAQILNTIFSYYSDGGRDQTINKLIEALLASKNDNTPQNPENSANNSIPKTYTTQEITDQSIPSSYKKPETPQPEATQVTEEKEAPPAPKLEKTPEIRGGSEIRSRRSRSRRSAKNRGPIPSKAGNVLNELGDFDETKSLASIFDVIKIADVLDKTQPEIAKIVDEYIKEHNDLIFSMPKFPLLGRVIKEDQPNSKENK